MSDSEEDIKTCSICEKKVDLNLNMEYMYRCDICDICYCENCIIEDKHYIIANTRDGRGFNGFCYECATKAHGSNMSIFFSSWINLYDEKEGKIQEKDTYIKQLEAEIELLKSMVYFQPEGDGYFATSTHFKQLATDQNKAMLATDQNKTDPYQQN